jgi:hypothetical protein
MSKLSCTATCPVKVSRKSYRSPTPFGYGILLPPAPPTAPLAPITPAALAEQIRTDLARLREIGRRQDELMAKVHGIRPVCGGSPEGPNDRNLDAMYEESRWIDHVAEMHRDPADLLL